jgi:DNA-binding MurR/RpiR family transcriptional regulator
MPYSNLTTGPTVDELEAQIAAAHDALPKKLKQIARYLLDNREQVAFQTLAIIAERADVNPSAIVRFANALGYSGFTELQKIYRNGLVTGQSDYRARVRQSLSSSGETILSSNELLARLARGASDALSDLAASVREDQLAQATTILHESSTIYIVGFRRSFGVSTYLAYALRHLGRKAILLDGLGGMLDEQVSVLDSSDSVIAISFAPYAEETQAVVEFARKNKAKIVTITDSVLSPIAANSDVALIAKEAEVIGFRTLTSSMCLSQALVMSLAEL